MVRFPSPLHHGEGVITEVLGPRGKPGVDTLSIIREYNLVEPFAEDALDDARREAEKFEESVPDGRTDYTKRTIVTIDPEDARDFDDAISLEKTKTGNWLLGVHIADVSHFVRPKSPLDREARNRATSVYLPDRVIPMLPEIISNSLASLQPGKVRLTKTALIEFTPDGLRVGVELQNSAIKSSKRLTYEQVDAFIADPEAWRKKLGAKVHELLTKMRTLAQFLRTRRMKKGALELTMPEVKIELDKHGRVSGAHVVENTESHQIIEEFMLAANEAVAETLERKGWPFIRRVHQPPTLRKLKALTAFVKELGYQVESLESRFELQKLLERRHRPARSTCGEFRHAAFLAAGGLQSRRGRPFRLGQRVLLPLHLAHPPLSRFDGASAGRCASRGPVHFPARKLVPRKKARPKTWSCPPPKWRKAKNLDSTRTSFSSSPSIAPTASSGPKPPNAN